MQLQDVIHTGSAVSSKNESERS